MQEAADLRLIARACTALALMSARYWTTAASATRRHLTRWRSEAEVIPDLNLRALALAKLADEQANTYFAATFATLAPRGQRATTIEAIVALQIIYDYLDGLTEQPAKEPLCDGLELFRALSDAVSCSQLPHRDYYSLHQHHEDGGYLARLVATARGALAELPATEAITDVAARATARCAETQVRAHAAPRLGTTQLERWASHQAAQEDVSWREFLAGAASAIISIHALVAAAAEPRTTREQAARIDAFYHRTTCPLATILDGLADLRRDQDSAEHQLGYLQYFAERDHLIEALVGFGRAARKDAPDIQHGGHHLMTLCGVVAYYSSALVPSETSSKAIVAPLQHELRPLIAPTLAFMRTWRFGRHLQRHPPRGLHIVAQRDTRRKRERLPT